ncbi:MAG: 50S ribosomal protein L32, partial [Vulcanimicrobiaceae bacterium]
SCSPRFRWDCGAGRVAKVYAVNVVRTLTRAIALIVTESHVANLKWKTPRSKTRSRRAANWNLNPVTTVACPQCKQPKRPHFVCGHCGMYDGRQVVEIKDDHAGHAHD